MTPRANNKANSSVVDDATELPRRITHHNLAISCRRVVSHYVLVAITEVC